MKLSAQEEYGLRCLLRIGARGDGGTLTIPEISRAEGISPEYVAKIMRILRRGGLVTSARGATGGYTLSRPADQITAGEALTVLGGRLFESGFCERHAGAESLCTHSIDCSLRSLWRALQTAVDQVLTKTTLKDLLCTEPEMVSLMTDLINVSSKSSVTATHLEQPSE